MHFLIVKENNSDFQCPIDIDNYLNNGYKLPNDSQYQICYSSVKYIDDDLFSNEKPILFYGWEINKLCSKNDIPLIHFVLMLAKLTANGVKIYDNSRYCLHYTLSYNGKEIDISEKLTSRFIIHNKCCNYVDEFMFHNNYNMIFDFIVDLLFGSSFEDNQFTEDDIDYIVGLTDNSVKVIEKNLF